ncbi:ATP-binding protein [Paenibacillus sp. UNC451MF]|uniref:ATP-binding protein n=1 Tax=Paenibacillus sp. UNC451MF TaxID=1449063 RepID=UPI000491D2A1|nr:ATP-binding protein [Paenibacillus sp. UNC451MF]
MKNNKTKTLIIVVVFLIILTGIRLLWNSINAIPEHPEAIQGVLDLRDWDFKTKPIMTLDGQWEFFPYTFLQSDSNRIAAASGQSSYLQVPGHWLSAFSSDPSASYYYGTYRLRILINDASKLTYAVRVANIQSASKLYVNGQLLEAVGQIGELEEHYAFRNIPYSADFQPDGGEIELVIQAANKKVVGDGGIIRPIQFGEEHALLIRTWISIGSQLAVCIILLIHAIYAVLLYVIGSRQKASITFSLLAISAMVSILVDDEQPLLTWIPFNYEWTIRLFFASYTCIALSLFQLANQWFRHSSYRVFSQFQLICGIYLAFILLAPVYWVMHSSYVLISMILLSGVIFSILILKMAMKSTQDMIFLLLGITAVTSSVLWGCIKNIMHVEFGYYPFDIIAALLAFAAFWFKQYFRTAEQTAALAQKLQKEDKLKDDFLANTSHELRNPLHGIINIAQYVLNNEHRSMADSNKKNLELLITVGRRMSFLLNDLLDITRLREKRVRLHTSSVQVQSVAAGVVDMLSFMTDGKPVKIRLHISDSFPNVSADENRLTQILFNLIQNAIKFTNEGTITIGARLKNGMAYIDVEDTGVGIDEAMIQVVFQPYEQADSSMTSIGGGIGLGLSICKQLVELHGGTLDAASKPGQGSVFTFSLPLAEPAGQPAQSAVEEDKPSASVKDLVLSSVGMMAAASASMPSVPEQTSKILVVDDDPLNLKILNGMLSAEGYDIVTANSGKEALELVHNGSWDLVIADVMMPYMSGYELTRTIRAQFKVSELPILLLTARSHPEDITTGFHAGANDYVIKPVEAYDLKARVRSLIDLKLSVEERLRMEAAWLQAQIKPHFFFNTINSISVLSDFDTDKMKQLLGEFAAYLQKSFDFQNSEQLVSLHRELELVRSYLAIESVRHEDRMRIEWDIDDKLQLQLPPLSIQPIVENALNHGILKNARGGTIAIQVKDHEDYAEIRITDNGMGMNETRLSELLNSPKDKKRGIGLVNTDRRLKNIYGRGLAIESTSGQGTTVSFQIPK